MIKQSTVLITGGSQGLGLEMAKRFIEQGNTVIVCVRSVATLEKAKKENPTLITFVCDLSLESDRIKLCDWIKAEHPATNVLINNAAIAHATNFNEDENSFEKLKMEIETNLVAPIHLTKLLLPVLLKNKNPKVINITTGLVYVPRAIYPFYNATKAALHSFTQVLRQQMSTTPLQVIEVLFPVVNTAWHKGPVPKIAIAAKEAVDGMMAGIRDNKEEIKVGAVKLLAVLVRIAPRFAFRKINSLQ